MREHLKFAVAYWHTMKGTGSDPFGGGVYERPWNKSGSELDNARYTLDAAFEFFAKLTVPHWCFHDRDIAPEGSSITESAANLQLMVDHAEALQRASGCSLLWGTANLFHIPVILMVQQQIPILWLWLMRQHKCDTPLMLPYN